MQWNITNIGEEQKYHSFIIAKTMDKQIAQKWDHYVLSCNGELFMNADQLNTSDNPSLNNNRNSDGANININTYTNNINLKDPINKNQPNSPIPNPNTKYWFNIGIDTIAYKLPTPSSPNQHKIILSQGNWLHPCLTSSQLTNLNNSRIIKFEHLSISKHVIFYYYINQPMHVDVSGRRCKGGGRQEFVQIKPKYLHINDCIIFQIGQIDPRNIQDYHQKQTKNCMLNRIHYKQIPSYVYAKRSKDKYMAKGKVNKQQNFYNFKSQYALISDQHFLNCLVRGRKSIGSYLRFDKYYHFWIDETLLQILETLYVAPKL